MTPLEAIYYIGIFIGCFLVTFVPYIRKKYIDRTIEEFEYDYLITMLFSFIISVVASLMLYGGAGNVAGDHFDVFIDGMKLGLFDNFWVNEVKKLLYGST